MVVRLRQCYLPCGLVYPASLLDSLGGVDWVGLEEPGGFLPEDSRFPESVKQRALDRAAYGSNPTPVVILILPRAVGFFKCNRVAVVLLRVEFLVDFIALFENNILVLRFFFSLVLA